MSYKNNKVDGLGKSIKIKQIKRSQLALEFHVSYKYSHINIPNCEKDVILSYSLEDELINGLVVINERSDTDNEDELGYYETPDVAWKICLNKLKIKYLHLEKHLQSRPISEITRNFLSEKGNDKHSRESWNKNKKLVKESLKLLDNPERLNNFFNKEMAGLNQNDFMNESVTIPDSPIGIGESIYVLHVGNLLDRRNTGSSFSMEEYVIVDRSVRLNIYHGRKNSNELEKYKLTFNAKPKQRKENGRYYDLQLYFDKAHHENTELTMFVDSYYLEVFKTKEDALRYVKSFIQEANDFVEVVSNM